jgi:hypothetical protein
MVSRYSLISGLLLLAIVPTIQFQIANAASIEVPKYASDPDLGMVVDGTQLTEYPDEKTKIEIPYRNDDKKAWINVEAYNICVQEDKDLTREAMADSGDLPEQQDNEAAAAEKEELLKSMDAEGMDICIEMNAQYADVHGIPN